MHAGILILAIEFLIHGSILLALLWIMIKLQKLIIIPGTARIGGARLRVWT